MDKKYLAIIVIVVAIILACGAYFLLNNSSVEYDGSVIELSKTAAMKVPNSNQTEDNVDSDGVGFYVDNENGINITICSNLSKSSAESSVSKIVNSFITGSKKLVGDNLVVFEKDGIYAILIKNMEYNDTIFMQSPNKDLILQCWNSIKFHSPTDKFKYDDASGGSSSSDSGEIISIADKTEQTVEKTSSSSSSSSYSSSSSSGASFTDNVGSGSSSSSGGKSSSGGGGSSLSFTEI